MDRRGHGPRGASDSHNQGRPGRHGRTTWRSIVAVVLSFVFCFVLAACGSSGDSPPATPAVDAESTSSAEARTVVPGIASAEESGEETPSAPDPRPFAGGTYTYNWDGQPEEPAPFTQTSQSSWDVQVHKRNHHTDPGRIDPMQAQHGPGCEAPHMTHEISTVEQTVFRCRDHVMTALNASDYGLIYLTPDHLADWSDGEAIVRFDMSTFRTSSRDWISINVQPFEANHALPLEDTFPDLQGMPAETVSIRLDQDGWSHRLHQGGERIRDTGECTRNDWDDWLEPDKSRRDTFEMRITPTNVTFGMPGYQQEICSINIPGGLDWDQGIVQFGHHSYTPSKDQDCSEAHQGDCGANTWHWSDVEISSAVPFTMIKPDRLWYNSRDANPETVTFQEPAPQNAYLRFASWGRVEIDYGDGWVAVEPLSLESREHARSHWLPVPEGTQQVQVRWSEDDWFTGPYTAQGFAIWAAP